MSTTQNKIYDVIIIGGGPGGASAAVYAVRGGLTVAVIDGGGSALLRAESVQNYYGIAQTSGEKLYRAGLSQARALGAEVFNEQVTFLSADGEKFTAQTPSGEMIGRRAVIAVGATSLRPANIAGLSELEGKGVSYCAVCDGFFYRKKRVGVIGAGEYARHEYDALKAVAGEVMLFTNGETPCFSAERSYAQKIARVAERNGRVGGIELEDGTTVELDGLFIAIGVMGGAGLAKSLGVFTDGNGFIKTDERGMTNIAGLYAVGDCTPGIKQVSRAVTDGMRAGLSVIADIKGGSNG